ncbi:hypothetical protein AB4254_08360 [Vibrio breoganii]
MTNNKVIIHEMCPETTGQEDLYELHFEGTDDFGGFDTQSDYLSAVDAHEIAIDVADEYDAKIEWSGMKPGWA